MQTVLFWTAATLYAVATALFFAWVAFRKERAQAVARALAWSALVPHAGAVALRWIEQGHGPWSTRFEVLSGQALFSAAVFLVASRLAPKLRWLGVVVLPIAFLMMGAAVSGFGVRNEAPIIFKSYWLILHIGFGKLFAVSSLLAAGCALGYLVKTRRPERLPLLPSAEDLDLYAHQFLLVGFLFLGVMIVAGSLWAHQSWGRYWGWDPIETSALVTWLALGLILHFRVLHGWSGARMAHLTLVGFVLAMATMYVVVMVVPTIHDSFMVGR
jgi:ABC-type transport system involved in cytochrome c biogenesis permease subunit